MLRVLQLSGQEIARLDQEFLGTLQEKKYGNSVRALKWHLSEAVGGVSIYRLKLIHGENPLEDARQLLSLMEGDPVEVIDLVLTILEYHAPTEDEEETFLAAADAGKTLELESMLQLPMDPNGVIVAPNAATDNMTEVDMSALILAANHGHLEAVELLLDAGADIEHMNSFDETALWFAAFGNHIEVLRHLMLRGAALNSQNRNQETPLMVAIRQCHEAAVDALIQAGAALKPPTLHLAAEHGYLRMVQLLIEGRAEVNGSDDLGRTALHIASQEKSVDVVRLLLESNADANAETQDGHTPLSLACIPTAADWRHPWAPAARMAARPGATPIARLLRTAGADLERAALLAGRAMVQRTLDE
eukprot:s1118_g2.t1